VQRGLHDVGIAPEIWGPFVLRLLGIKAGSERVATFSPHAQRARTFEVLEQLCLSSSRQRPLILEIENLHWIDPTSEEWLMSLVERLAGAPILLLVSFRPGYRPSWMDKSYATQLALQRLSVDHSRRVVQAVRHAVAVSDNLVQAIVAKADGNPFFLEELTRAVVEYSDDPASLAIPDTVQAVLTARIDRLPPATKHLLQVAAVIGMEVPVPLLQAITTLPEATSRQSLEHLGGAVSRDRRKPAGTAGASLHGSRPQRAGCGLLATCW
jgi:predicted ATPase